MAAIVFGEDAHRRAEAAATEVSLLGIPAPSIDHMHYTEFEHVYEPAEDTFLLMDALTKDAAELRALPEGFVSLEIGAGSGMVTAHLSALLRPASSQTLPISASQLTGDGSGTAAAADEGGGGGDGGDDDESVTTDRNGQKNVRRMHAIHFATDINGLAASAVQRTGKANKVPHLEVVRTDLANGLDHRMKGLVDILIFNPPYVPTPPEEVGSEGIEAAWAGGRDGREVIDRLLPNIGALLTPPGRTSSGGRCYIVLVEENRPNDVAQILAAQGLSASCVVKRRAKNESLAIYKFEWNNTSQSATAGQMTAGTQMCSGSTVQTI